MANSSPAQALCVVLDPDSYFARVYVDLGADCKGTETMSDTLWGAILSN